MSIRETMRDAGYEIVIAPGPRGEMCVWAQGDHTKIDLMILELIDDPVEYMRNEERHNRRELGDD